MMKKFNKYITIDVRKMSSPPTDDGFYRLLTDRWWAVDKNDNVLFYGSFSKPQCNHIKEIFSKHLNNLEYPHDRMVFLKSAWIPVDISEYT